MESNNKQLKARLIELRKAIKRKYRAFKEGTVETDIMLEKQYKPIITELRKTQPKAQAYIKKEPKKEVKQESETNTENNEQAQLDDDERGYQTDDDDLDFHPPVVSTPTLDETSPDRSSPSSSLTTSQYVEEYFKHPLTKEYMKLFMSDVSGQRKSIDYTYGPRYENDTLMIGDQKLDFTQDGEILIGGSNYGASGGVYELLFKRMPDKTLYTDNDLKTYKSILFATNAHRDGYRFNSKIKRNKSSKYTTIIKHLFPPATGKGFMTWKAVKARDIIHWNDPNELVERLQHIILSTETGNRVHTNEIVSILEELREDGYIKGHGNSRLKSLLQ